MSTEQESIAGLERPPAFVQLVWRVLITPLRVKTSGVVPDLSPRTSMVFVGNYIRAQTRQIDCTNESLGLRPTRVSVLRHGLKLYLADYTVPLGMDGPCDCTQPADGSLGEILNIGRFSGNGLCSTT